MLFLSSFRGTIIQELYNIIIGQFLKFRCTYFQLKNFQLKLNIVLAQFVTNVETHYKPLQKAESQQFKVTFTYKDVNGPEKGVYYRHALSRSNKSDSESKHLFSLGGSTNQRRCP